MSLNIVIDWQEFSVMFRGHKITMELRPLNRAAMMRLAPHMGKTQEDITLSFLDSLEVQEAARDILPDHCREIKGMTVNGAPPTVDALADEVALNPLTVDIIGELARLTTLQAQDEKN